MNPITILLIAFVVTVAVILAACAFCLAQQRANYRQLFDDQRQLLEDAREDANDMLDRLYEKHGHPPAGTDMPERHEQREHSRAEGLKRARSNKRPATPMTLAGMHKVLQDEEGGAKRPA